jgi:DNA-binding transcriptional regulator PaaX
MKIRPISRKIQFSGKDLTLEEINKQAQERYKKEQEDKKLRWKLLILKPQKYNKDNNKEGKKLDEIA